MAIFDYEWDTPSINKSWRVNDSDDGDIDDDDHYKFKLNIDFEGRDIIKQKYLKEIPDDTQTLTIDLHSIVNETVQDEPVSKYLVLDQNYIPHSVTDLRITNTHGFGEGYYTPNVVYQGEWIPDSVTMLSITSLPFPLSQIPSSVKYLKIIEQRGPIEIEMVPPTIEYLYILHSNCPIPHEIPNTVKELVLLVSNSKDIKINSTFTSPIHIRCSDNERRITQDLITRNINIRSINYLTRIITPMILPPTITSLILHEDTKFNDCLSALYSHPQLKYLSLPTTFNQPIYQNQHLPITLTHLELSIVDDKRSNRFTNKWLSKKGYLPQSITHLKINIWYIDDETNLEEEDNTDDKLMDDSILLPSSIQSICLNPDRKRYRSCITIIDRDHYYSIIPTPKIKNGLKELILPHSFNQTITNNTLPSTLESLSILNEFYNKPITSDNVPTTLTSLKSNSKFIELDLSQYKSIKQLELTTINDRSIINYPPNLESLLLRNHTLYDQANNQFNFVNKHLIKRLEIFTLAEKMHKQLLSIDFPNLQYLAISFLGTKVPESVKELDITRISENFEEYLSPNIKDIHLNLIPKTLKAVSIPNNSKVIKKNNHFPNLPMTDNFFKLWRNVYIKSMILESLYDLIRSTLKYNHQKGTLDHMDRFKNYNITVGFYEKVFPSLLKFDKAIQIDIRMPNVKVNISQLIPRTVKKLKCHIFQNVPNWITHLDLKSWDDFNVALIPKSVTNLGICKVKSNLSKIPSTIKYLTLYDLNHISDKKENTIPPTITYLTLLNIKVNTLKQSDIPNTIQKIEFKKYDVETYGSANYHIPLWLSSRLVNGVFYIYSKLNNQTTIPLNTTHLFWFDDDHYISNDEINIPTSVHTLVLSNRFNSPILSLPTSITQMVFNGALNQSLESIRFPQSLKYLKLFSCQDEIEEHHLPNGLTHLVLGDTDSCRFKSLPTSVHHLEIKGKRLSGSIPPQIKHLRFDGSPLINVSSTIKSILDSSFSDIKFIDTTNQEIVSSSSSKSTSPFNSDTNIHLYSSYLNRFIVPYTLGNNIKSISFGNGFNQLIVNGTLPNSIEYLDFGARFNQKLNKSLLPTSLLTLKLGKSFNQDINDLFPSTLTELSLEIQSKPSIKSSSQFPPHLKKLSILCYDGVLDIIPTTIDYLKLVLHNVYHDDHHKILPFPIELVPSNITKLVLDDKMYIKSYDIIPSTIKSIKLCKSLKQGTKIPITIESVELYSSFNEPLSTILQTDHDNQLNIK